MIYFFTPYSFDFKLLDAIGCCMELLQPDDWGSFMSLFTVCHESIVVDNFINEFFVKPDNPNGVMINTLTDQFTDYYRHHHDKTIIYYRDRYGDSKNPNVNKSASYNDQAIARLEKVGAIQNSCNRRCVADRRSTVKFGGGMALLVHWHDRSVNKRCARLPKVRHDL